MAFYGVFTSGAVNVSAEEREEECLTSSVRDLSRGPRAGPELPHTHTHKDTHLLSGSYTTKH